MVTKKKKIESRQICTMQHSDKCKNRKGEWLMKDYYTAINDKFFANGRVHICKECIKDYVYNDEGEVNLDKFKEILMMINTPFYTKEFKTSVKKDKDTVGVYMRATYLNHKGEGWHDGEKDGSFEEDEEVKYKIDFELTQEVIDFWGMGMDTSDYLFLEREFSRLVSSYECDSYAQETLFQEIAYQRLAIKKKRIRGEATDKELKTLQDLLGSANIKPVQETGSEANDQVTFGTFLKKWENDKPIKRELDDEMKKYIDTFMAGHLAKMEGLSNELVDKYEDEISQHSINFDDIYEGDD